MFSASSSPSPCPCPASTTCSDMKLVARPCAFAGQGLFASGVLGMYRLILAPVVLDALRKEDVQVVLEEG